jgi:transcriptional regulator with XRE-family HTH domain
MKGIHTKEQAIFIARLKTARKEIGLTQEEVAQKLGYGQSAISKIERGELRVGAVELKQFAKLYKKNIEYFLK